MSCSRRASGISSSRRMCSTRAKSSRGTTRSSHRTRKSSYSNSLDNSTTWHDTKGGDILQVMVLVGIEESSRLAVVVVIVVVETARF